MEKSGTTIEKPTVEVLSKIVPEKEIRDRIKTKSDENLTLNIKVDNGVILVPSPSDDPRDPLVCNSPRYRQNYILIFFL